MTEPTDRDQATRDRLAEALRARYGTYEQRGYVNCDEIAAELLPVVADLVREGQAEALELAAVLTVPDEDTSEDVRQALFRRAAALRAPREVTS